MSMKTLSCCFLTLLLLFHDASSLNSVEVISKTVSIEPKSTKIVSNQNEKNFVPLGRRPFSLLKATRFEDEASSFELQESENRSRRHVRKIQKYTRLPVWPVWNGVLIWLVGKLLGDQVAAKVEDTITGRVCPNFYEYSETSPFIMLVHHCHSFAPFDPLRYLQRTFFPEGFPAHPHRGFITVTYFLDGGFRHRDSMGIKQMYGAEKRHGGKHTQWLETGAGVLHEEMFDMAQENLFMPIRQELYQLWLNVPASHKLDSPRTLLLGGDDETPTIVEKDNQGRTTKTLLLAGSYQTYQAVAPIESKLSIMHVRMDPQTTWQYDLPASFETVVMYIRQGSLLDNDTVLPAHHTVYFENNGERIVLHAEKDGADFMLLAGEPIREPCVAQGSMVMNSGGEINQAYQDYQMGAFGRPWKESLTDKEWEQHVHLYPSQYYSKGSETAARIRTP